MLGYLVMAVLSWFDHVVCRRLLNSSNRMNGVNVFQNKISLSSLPWNTVQLFISTTSGQIVMSCLIYLSQLNRSQSQVMQRPCWAARTPTGRTRRKAKGKGKETLLAVLSGLTGAAGTAGGNQHPKMNVSFITTMMLMSVTSRTRLSKENHCHLPRMDTALAVGTHVIELTSLRGIMTSHTPSIQAVRLVVNTKKSHNSSRKIQMHPMWHMLSEQAILRSSPAQVRRCQLVTMPLPRRSVKDLLAIFSTAQPDDVSSQTELNTTDVSQQTTQQTDSTASQPSSSQLDGVCEAIPTLEVALSAQDSDSTAPVLHTHRRAYGRKSEKVATSCDTQELHQEMIPKFVVSSRVNTSGTQAYFQHKCKFTNDNKSVLDINEADTTTPSGCRPFGVRQNDTTTPSGSRPLGVRQNDTTTPSGSRPLGVRQNDSTTPSGCRPLGVRQNDTTTPSGSRSLGVRQNDTTTPSGCRPLGVRQNDTTTPSRSRPLGVRQNDTTKPSGSRPLGVRQNDTTTPSGCRPLGVRQNDTTTPSGSRSLGVRQNDTTTPSGCRPLGVRQNDTTTPSRSRPLGVRQNDTTKPSGSRPLGVRQNDNTTPSGCRPLGVRQNDTTTPSGCRPLGVRQNDTTTPSGCRPLDVKQNDTKRQSGCRPLGVRQNDSTMADDTSLRPADVKCKVWLSNNFSSWRKILHSTQSVPAKPVDTLTPLNMAVSVQPRRTSTDTETDNMADDECSDTDSTICSCSHNRPLYHQRSVNSGMYTDVVPRHVSRKTIEKQVERGSNMSIDRKTLSADKQCTPKGLDQDLTFRCGTGQDVATVVKVAAIRPKHTMLPTKKFASNHRPRVASNDIDTLPTYYKTNPHISSPPRQPFTVSGDMPSPRHEHCQLLQNCSNSTAARLSFSTTTGQVATVSEANVTPTRTTPSSRRQLDSDTCRTPQASDLFSLRVSSPLKLSSSRPVSPGPNEFRAGRSHGAAESPSVLFAKLKLLSPSVRLGIDHTYTDSGPTNSKSDLGLAAVPLLQTDTQRPNVSNKPGQRPRGPPPLQPTDFLNGAQRQGSLNSAVSVCVIPCSDKSVRHCKAAKSSSQKIHYAASPTSAMRPLMKRNEHDDIALLEKGLNSFGESRPMVPRSIDDEFSVRRHAGLPKRPWGSVAL